MFIRRGCKTQTRFTRVETQPRLILSNCRQVSFCFSLFYAFTSIFTRRACRDIQHKRKAEYPLHRVKSPCTICPIDILLPAEIVASNERSEAILATFKYWSFESRRYIVSQNSSRKASVHFSRRYTNYSGRLHCSPLPVVALAAYNNKGLQTR